MPTPPMARAEGSRLARVNAKLNMADPSAFAGRGLSTDELLIDLFGEASDRHGSE